MSSDAHVVELLPAYTLDCLDEEDTILVSEHLALCDVCRAELRAYQAVTDQLALAMPDAVPPPDLKHRLMDYIQSPRPTVPPQPQLSWWQSLASFIQPTTPVWGLASLLLIIALAAGNLWLWQQVRQPEVMTQPGMMQAITLTSTEEAPDATGLLVISADGEYGTLVVDGLPPLGEERQYQLWLIQNGQRTSGGVFSVSQEGYGSLWISSPKPLSNYSAFGITIEPAGGSPGPTGNKVLGSSL